MSSESYLCTCIPSSGLTSRTVDPKLNLSSSTAHDVYLSPNFSAHELSASILAGEAYDPSAPASAAGTEPSKAVTKSTSKPNGETKPDIPLALARLQYSIDEVTRGLRSEVRGRLAKQ
jgi:hypothetical protein